MDIIKSLSSLSGNSTVTWRWPTLYKPRLFETQCKCTTLCKEGANSHLRMLETPS
jgi:hypothetical protein